MRQIMTREEITPIVDYIREDKKAVPYLYVNLRNFDPEDDNVKVWCEDGRNGIVSVFLLYYDCLHFYAKQVTVEQLDLLRMKIKEVEPKVMMLPEEAGKAMREELTAYTLERNYIIDMDNVGVKEQDFKSVVAGREDIVPICDLLLTEEEYSIVYDRDVLIAQSLARFDQGISRYYAIKEDGMVVAACSTYGETDDLAPVGGVIVHKDYRRKGYAADVENHICQDLGREGKTRIGFVNYLNTPSLALHKKIGSIVHASYYKYIGE